MLKFYQLASDAMRHTFILQIYLMKEADTEKRAAHSCVTRLPAACGSKSSLDSLGVMLVQAGWNRLEG